MQQFSPGLTITIATDTINNLYTMLGNYELDLAIVEGPGVNVSHRSMMLDTDFLVCVMSVNNPLSRNALVTLAELKRQRMILRLPTSATRVLFDSALLSMNESLDNFNVIIQVDNIATIKDLVRKELGVSVLPRSACLDELRKGKLTALPIENLSMVRETRIVYNGDFSHMDIMQVIREYRETARMYRKKESNFAAKRTRFLTFCRRWYAIIPALQNRSFEREVPAHESSGALFRNHRQVCLYPMLIGFIALCSVAVNRGKPLGALSTLVAAVCAILCVVALLSKTLCKKAGIDDKIV